MAVALTRTIAKLCFVRLSSFFCWQFVVDNMTTRKWDDRYDVLHYLRQIVKFSPESLVPHL